MKELIFDFFKAIIGAPFYALVFASILRSFVEGYFKFKPSYGMAYKASLLAQLMATLAGFIAIILFAITGFDLNTTALAFGAIISLATHTYIYGRMFVHPDNGPIGFKNAAKITGTILAVGVGFIGVILFIFRDFSYPSQSSTNTDANSNQYPTNQVTSHQITPVNPAPYVNNNQNRLAPAAQLWVDMNPWFQTAGFEYLSQRAIDISAEIEQSGYDRNDPALYIELDRRLSSYKTNMQSTLIPLSPNVITIGGGSKPIGFAPSTYPDSQPVQQPAQPETDEEIFRRGGVPQKWLDMVNQPVPQSEISSKDNTGSKEKKSGNKHPSQSSVRYNPRTGVYTID